MAKRSTDKLTPLAGKVALVTGASRGIGLAIARTLAHQGCNLALAARDERALRNLTKRADFANVRLLTHPCDVRDPHSVDTLFRLVRKQFRHIDVLVNNAGVAHENVPLERMPFPLWKDVFATNVDGTFLVTQAALGMMRRGGTIVNNLSIAATRVFAGSAAYNASKHAALGLTNTLREELRPRGIRVIALMPGATDTDIWKTLWPDAPRKKMMSAETVAQAVVHAILLPENTTMESLELLPSVGTL